MLAQRSTTHDHANLGPRAGRRPPGSWQDAPMMKLVSLQVGRPREVVDGRGRTVVTGIYKEPVAGRVVLRRLNVDGDAQADLTVHGGVDQAVYAYPAEHYPLWRGELGRDGLPYGTFGENFTVAGMREDEVAIGDLFRVGGAVVEVTQPRAPCFKLALKMGMPEFPKRFLASGRTGYYLRVREEGEIGAGDAIERLTAGTGGMTVLRIGRLRFFDHDDLEGVAAAAALPALSPGWRQWFAGRLAAAGEPDQPATMLTSRPGT